jgi:hypothetical protein
MKYKATLILLLFILLKLILQYFAIDPIYELHRDEFLHIDLGKHLAWGYTSVPPVTAWISYLILQLGGSEFLVKLVPCLFGVLLLLLVWKTVKELGGGLFAMSLAAACVVFSSFLRINTLYQPNSLEYLLWAYLFFALIKFINTEQNKWLYFAMIGFAFGFLNKYNIAFLMLGLLPALLISKHRTVLLNKHLYFSLLLAFLIVLPNIIWQINNDFPVVRHMKTLSETQLVNVNRWEFISSQLLMMLSSLIVLFVAFVGFFSHKPLRKYRIFFYTYLFVIVIYTYLRAKGYYALGLYPVLFAFGAVYMEHLLAKKWWYYLRIPVLMMPVFIIMPMYQYMLPVLPPNKIVEQKEMFQKMGLLRWEDGKDHHMPQDFADMIGWKELAALVDTAFADIEEKDNCIIHCDNYGQAGAINFYCKQKYSSAYSLNADYIYWYPLDEMEIRHVILVQHASDDDPERKREKQLFDEVKLIGKIENKNAREKGTSVYLLKGAKQSINDILAKEIEQRIGN